MKSPSAFPHEVFGRSMPAEQGLTKRELFAAMILQGLVGGKYAWPGKDDISYLVKASINAADELINKLENE